MGAAVLENVYTVLVGKNGVGKSRLLADIVKALRVDLRPTPADELWGDPEPKIIAVSTSPFDRFPAPVRSGDNAGSNYRYVGMRRDAFSSFSSVGLVASAARGVIEKLGRRTALHGLVSVFEAIGCEPEAAFQFKPTHKSPRSHFLGRDDSSVLVQSPHLGELQNLLRSEIHPGLARSFSKKDLEGQWRILDAVHQMSEWLSLNRTVTISINFERREAHIDGSFVDSNKFVHSMMVLIDEGFIRFTDLHLQKKQFGEMSLRRASSGEQCMLVMMLGIAGHISDGSLVLIDEPEISLHPEWQERFVNLLKSSFNHFSRCQFIIATHSPQIVSEMDPHNSYVLSLSRNMLKNAAEFSDRSADFQLAELFETPGSRNEYISRRAFNLLARLRASKQSTDADRAELAHLNWLVAAASPSDPLVELVESIEKLLGFYAENK